MDDQQVIAKFSVDQDLYEVHNESGQPVLYAYGEGGHRYGQMWWLSISSGLGKFRAVAKQGFSVAEAKATAKQGAAAKKRPVVVHHTYRSPGWRGHVALREQVKDHLDIVESWVEKVVAGK